MLSELLSPRSFDDCLLEYKEVIEQARDVARLYAYGAGPEMARQWNATYPGTINPEGRRVWEHAEEFLEQLDFASEKSQLVGAQEAAERLARLADASDPKEKKHSVEVIRGYHHLAQRLVAAECCRFLKNNHMFLERWQPYKRWVSHLDGSDTIVSFNYDRVVELSHDGLANDLEEEMLVADRDYGETSQQYLQLKEKFTRINATSPTVVLNASDLELGGPKLFKLHGSVDWKPALAPYADSVPWQVSGTSDYAVKCEEPTLAIATPGEGKHYASKGQLAPLWHWAWKAISEAQVIVFLGYRFPPSDAFARSTLLSAVRANKKNKVCVHIVLGDSDRDASRLRQLLNHSLGFPTLNRIRTQGLFVQDFLSVVEPRYLWFPG